MASDPRCGARRRKVVAWHKARVRSGVPCAICGRPIDLDLKYPDPWSFVVDEIVPVARGGDPLTRRNTEPAHRWCNSVKRTNSLEWARKEVAMLLAGQRGQRRTIASAPHKKLGI